YASRGLIAEALASAERAHQLAPWTACTVGLLAGTCCRAGDERRHSQLVDELHKMPGQPPWGMVLYCMISGDVERAAQWVEKAIEQRDLMTIIQIRSPLAGPLRASAHWPALA